MRSLTHEFATQRNATPPRHESWDTPGPWDGPRHAPVAHRALRARWPLAGLLGHAAIVATRPRVRQADPSGLTPAPALLYCRRPTADLYGIHSIRETFT